MSAAPSLYRLISNYWDREDLHLQTIRTTDDAESEEAEKKARAAQSKACDAANDAFVAVCAFVPVTLSDARLKAEFIEARLNDTISALEDEALDALLATVAQTTLHSARAGQ